MKKVSTSDVMVRVKVKVWANCVMVWSVVLVIVY